MDLRTQRRAAGAGGRRPAASPPACRDPAGPQGAARVAAARACPSTRSTRTAGRAHGSRDHQGVALQVDAFAYAPAEELLGGRRASSCSTRSATRATSEPWRAAPWRPEPAASSCPSTARPRSRRPRSRLPPGPSSICRSPRSPTSSAFSRRPRTPAAGCTARPVERRLVPSARPHRPRGPRLRRRGPRPAAPGGPHLRRAGADPDGGAGREPQRERGGGLVPLRGSAPARGGGRAGAGPPR